MPKQLPYYIPIDESAPKGFTRNLVKKLRQAVPELEEYMIEPYKSLNSEDNKRYLRIKVQLSDDNLRALYEAVNYELSSINIPTTPIPEELNSAWEKANTSQPSLDAQTQQDINRNENITVPKKIPLGNNLPDGTVTKAILPRLHSDPQLQDYAHLITAKRNNTTGNRFIILNENLGKISNYLRVYEIINEEIARINYPPINIPSNIISQMVNENLRNTGTNYENFGTKAPENSSQIAGTSKILNPTSVSNTKFQIK